MNFIIRKADRSDLPELCKLMSHLSGHEISLPEMENRLAFIETSPIDQLFVIESESRVKGLVGFRIRENIEELSRYGEISVVVTDPDARRAGYGKSLLEFAEQLARQKGCKGAWLVSGFGREEEAHHFYKKLGYQVTGYRFVKHFEPDTTQ